MTPEKTRPIDAEKQYRFYYLKGDIKLSSLVILVWLLNVVIFIPVDYNSLGASREFFQFLTARLVFTAANIVIVFALRNVSDPPRYDVLISIVMVMAAIFFIIGSRTLNRDFVGQLIMNELVIISIYAIIPAPLVTKVSVGTLLLIELASLLFRQEPSPLISRASILTGLVATNILGIISWFAISQFRHAQFNIQRQLEQAKKQAEILARTDPLTEVNNRRAFIEIGEVEFARAIRYQRNLSIIVFDLDNFKATNDQHGHQAGDIVLKSFAGRFAREIRHQDLLARLGGDEFGLLLPETDVEEATRIATRICEEFRQVPIPINGHSINASTSAGAAALSSSDTSFDAILKRADQKLYQSKRTGKNRIKP